MSGDNKPDTVTWLEIDRSKHHVTFVAARTQHYNDRRSETVGNRSLAKRVKTVFRSHQEIHVTNQVNGLVELARKQNDYITINFLQWFLTEQLEEVSLMDNLLKIIERAGDDLLQADEYLARVGVRAIPEPLKE